MDAANFCCFTAERFCPSYLRIMSCYINTVRWVNNREIEKLVWELFHGNEAIHVISDIQSVASLISAPQLGQNGECRNAGTE